MITEAKLLHELESEGKLFKDSQDHIQLHKDILFLMHGFHEAQKEKGATDTDLQDFTNQYLTSKIAVIIKRLEAIEALLKPVAKA